MELLIRQLDSFDPAARRTALRELAGNSKGLPPLSGAVNVHLHTFFSFNAEGWSPARVVWEARAAGLDVAGSVDFDVLDAMDELFAAGDALEIRTVAALETRVFVADYAEHDINSPGEPGVSYFMGTGFTRLPGPECSAARCLAAMRRTADERNRALLARLGACLAPLAVDYDRDVLPLTPSGNATERHMLVALDRAAHGRFPDQAELADYWSARLGLARAKVLPLLADKPGLLNAIRAKLMKRGGAGYVQPDAATFPPLAEVVQMVLDCEAIPCMTWLDGTSSGEADPHKLLDDCLEAGCLAANIVPDRNWNIKDPGLKAAKVANLHRFVAAAAERDLIISVGTEMNSYGQRLVDDFAAPELLPVTADFRKGAYILYGHTLLQRALGKGRTSAWAREAFGQDRGAANAFYLAVGEKGFPPREARDRLAGLDGDYGKQDILARL